MYIEGSIRGFIDKLSGPDPYPGGGSAACLVGALGISLALMVGKITRKKKKKTGAALPSFFAGCLKELSRLKLFALRSIDGDIRTYKKVVDAYALRKDASVRAAKIEQALKGGYLFQKNFAKALVKARQCHQQIEGIAQGSIASDLVLSRDFLQASFKGACQTARINLEYVKDEEFKRRESETLNSLAEAFEMARSL